MRSERPKHYWRNLSLALGGALLAAILILFGVLVNMIIHYAANGLEPPRRPIDCNPADRGIVTYQEASFTTDDTIMLRGWYVPSRNGAAIILAHGYAGTRCDLLLEAEILSGDGYGVLLFDLRGHGISGGDKVTFGDRERRDLAAAVDFVIEQPGVDPERIGALGFSMGGATVTESAAHDPRLKAVVIEAAFADLRETTRYRARLLGPLSKTLAVWSVQHQGVHLDEVRPVDALCQISPRPVLLIYGDRDKDIPTGDAQEMIGAVCDPAETWLIHGAGHGNYPAVVGDEYAARLLAFFGETLGEE